MPVDNRAHADVIVVGAGLAGMMAALAAEQAGADVILADRGAIGIGTNSALSNGTFSGPVSADRMEEWIDLVLQIGKRLNCVSYVRRVAHDAPTAVAFLESLGLVIVRTSGQWTVRSASPATIPGVSLVRRVADLVAGRDGIRTMRGFYVEAMVGASGRIVGVRGVRLDGGELEIVAQGQPAWKAPHFVWYVREELRERLCGEAETCDTLEQGGLRFRGLGE